MANKILVRLMTTASGPDFQFRPGDEGLVDSDQAEAMIAAGYAVRLTAEPATEATGPAVTVEANEAPAAEDWTASVEEAVGDEDGEDEKSMARVAAPAVETATAGPQRSSVSDDQLAAERAGQEAAEADEPRTANPYDRRTALGKAWDRGWESAQ